MTEAKFIELWNGTVARWIGDSFILIDNEVERTVSFSDVCSVKNDVVHRIYQNYEHVKSIVKKLYFKDKTKRISKYKRAAVIIYAIIAGQDPLEYKVEKSKYRKMFLKQRFALNMALSSIMQSYEINLSELKEPIFKFDELGAPVDQGDDDFLLSVYKDIYYSEQHKNFNILSMANIFGLLVERASILDRFKLVKSDD